MTFTKADFPKVAKLARLSLSDDEMSGLMHDLEKIVAFVAQLQEVDVSSVKPMSHAGDRTLMLREDVALEVLGRECIKSSAGYEEGLIRVPKIIE